MRVLVLCAMLVMLLSGPMHGADLEYMRKVLAEKTFRCGKHWITFNGKELFMIRYKEGKAKPFFHEPMSHTFRRGDILHLRDAGRSVYTKPVVGDGHTVQIADSQPSERPWQHFHVSPETATKLIQCLD